MCAKFVFVLFYSAPQALYMCYDKSVRPSVCPSHYGIVLKPGNAERYGLHCQGSPVSVVF